MRIRVLVFALVAVIALVAAGGCSDTQEETISNTIRDYYSAYNAMDWESCLGHLDDPGKVGTSVIRSALELARATTGEVTVESIANVEISGSTATADVTLTYGGQKETREYPLVKKDGHWKIAWR